MLQKRRFLSSIRHRVRMRKKRIHREWLRAQLQRIDHPRGFQAWTIPSDCHIPVHFAVPARRIEWPGAKWTRVIHLTGISLFMGRKRVDKNIAHFAPLFCGLPSSYVLVMRADISSKFVLFQEDLNHRFRIVE